MQRRSVGIPQQRLVEDLARLLVVVDREVRVGERLARLAVERIVADRAPQLLQRLVVPILPLERLSMQEPKVASNDLVGIRILQRNDRFAEALGRLLPLVA